MTTTARIQLIAIALFAIGPLATSSAVAQGGYGVDLWCEAGGCPEVRHGAQRWVVAEFGDRYAVRVYNRSSGWVEAVISVDGRDVLNGQTAHASNRGYLVAPYDFVEVTGWRTSDDSVATFRFTSVPDSYAGRVDGGSRAGQIQVSFFPGRLRNPPPPPVWVPQEPEWYGHRGDVDDAPSDRWAEGDGELADSAPPTGRGQPLGKSDAKASRSPESSAAGIVGRRRPPRPAQELGTQYGEWRESSIEHVSFVRNHSSVPTRTLRLRYDSRRGLLRRGILPNPPVWEIPRYHPTPRPQPTPYGYVAPPPGY